MNLLHPISTVLPCLVVALAAVPAAAETPAEEVASAYGIEHWDRIDRVDFTFAVELPGGKEVARRWSWEPERDGGTVTLEPGTDSALRFHTSDPAEDGTDLFAAKRNFVNDSYWLAFPFQLVWSDPAVLDAGPASMPISGERAARKLTAAWPAEGGYTPADSYDLYLGDDGRIDEWVFRKGSGTDGRPATWENEQTVAGVTFATEHAGPAGASFRLFFPELEVWADGAAEPTVLRAD